MKKLFTLLFILLLVSFSALADTAPQEIQAAFSASQWKDWSIARWEANHQYLAVAILRKDNVNRLCVLEEINNAWQLVVHSSDAIYQNRMPDDIILDGSGAFELHYDQNILRFAKNRGIWRVSKVVIADEGLEYDTIVVYSNKLEYLGKGGELYGTSVSGVTNRDLAYFVLKDLPRTPLQARQQLSLPPSIPQGGLNAEVISFEGGHKFPVYAGPGTDYLRPAAGKCVVSTNDWIQVFGQEDDWLLIQYDRNSSQMRFGYIQADSLRYSSVKQGDITPLAFSYLPVTTTADAKLTDDPLYGREALASVPKGTTLTYLTRMGDWAYVEYAPITAKKSVGFVPEKALDSLRPTLPPTLTATPIPTVKTYPLEAHFAHYDVRGTAYIGSDDRLTVDLQISGAGVGLIEGYTLYFNQTAITYVPGVSSGREYFRKPEFEYGSTLTVSFQHLLSPMPTIIGLCPVKNGQPDAREMLTLIP